jgi:hypothetical protein
MTSEELRNLLSQREGLKLDFKREYHLSKTPPPSANPNDWSKLVTGQRHELIKDILALTNGNVGTADEPGYLIIGAGDDEFLRPDGTRPLFDMGHIQLTSAGLLQMVNDACYPPLPDILCEKLDLDGKTIVAITIPPSPHVHEISKSLNCVGGSIDSLTGRLSITKDKPFTSRTAFIRRVDGVYPASEAERRALAADKSPETFVIASEPLNLEEFVIPESEREKVRQIFVSPRWYAKAEEIISKTGRLWLVGPSGLWKRYLALSLALKHQVIGEIYRVPRYIDWGQLAASEVRDSTIIFPDPLGLVQYEGEKIEGEFRPWDKLRANGNLIIATSSDEVFAEARKETRLSEFVPNDEIFSLNADAYDHKAKTDIFKRLVYYAGGQGLISESQRTLAIGLLEKDAYDRSNGAGVAELTRAQLLRLFRETWLPIDIERFVFDSLPNVTGAQDVLDLLRRDSDIEKRVRTWFCALDESARCFVLTLSIFSGFEDKEIWCRHQEIIKRLRRLDPMLSAPPLGILRHRAQPYVTSEGPLEFVNTRVFRIVLKEVAKNYREYFADEEIMSLLKEWSIPDPTTYQTKDERAELIRKTEDVRNAIARVTGIMGMFGLNDIQWLLKEWATHKIGRIGKTAGLALKEMAKDPASAYQAIALLNEWSADMSTPDSHNLRWASASALGRIASLRSQFGTSEQALMILQRLAGDQSDYVVSAVPQAFRMMGSGLPVEALGGVLTRLAKRDSFTQQEVARALDEASGQKADSVCKLLDTWAASRNVNVRRTAILTLLTSRKLPRDDKYPRLIKFLESGSGLVLETLLEVLKEGNDEHKQSAQSFLAGLASHSPEGRSQLISALSKTYEKNPNKTQQLFDRILEGGDTRLRDVAAETHAKVSNIAIRTLLEEPSEQRNVFLAQLLIRRSEQFVIILLEALKAGTHAKFDWFLAKALEVTSPFGDLRVGAFSGVEEEMNYVISQIREVEIVKLEDVRQKITTAREEAAKAGIKDLPAIDEKLSEAARLSVSRSYLDVRRATGIAGEAYAALLPTLDEMLSKLINAQSIRLKNLKAQSNNRKLQQQIKTETGTVVSLIWIASLVVALIIGYGLSFFVQPASIVRFPSGVKINNITYPPETQFEIISETDSEICLELASDKPCLDKAATLRLGNKTSSYTSRSIIYMILIVVALFALWILISTALTFQYRGRLVTVQRYDFDRSIQKTERAIRDLTATKERIMKSVSTT